ncbi:hypothetical protein AGLY_006994, partial [Aphis glycines]
MSRYSILTSLKKCVHNNFDLIDIGTKILHCWVCYTSHLTSSATESEEYVVQILALIILHSCINQSIRHSVYSQGIGTGYCLSWINVSMAFESVRMVDKVKHASRTFGGASSSSPGIHRVGRLFIRHSLTLATTNSTSALVSIVLEFYMKFSLIKLLNQDLTFTFDLLGSDNGGDIIGGKNYNYMEENQLLFLILIINIKLGIKLIVYIMLNYSPILILEEETHLIIKNNTFVSIKQMSEISIIIMSDIKALIKTKNFVIQIVPINKFNNKKKNSKIVNSELQFDVNKIGRMNLKWKTNKNCILVFVHLESFKILLFISDTDNRFRKQQNTTSKNFNENSKNLLRNHL